MLNGSFGIVESGEGKGSIFIEEIAEKIEMFVGFKPFFGTLNLENIDKRGLDKIEIKEIGNDICKGFITHKCRINGIVSATVIPMIEGYPEKKTEIISPVELRKLFGLKNGENVLFSAEKDRWESNGAMINLKELDLFESIIFDLDQTLVHLDVDWNRAYKDLESLVEEYIEGPIEDYRHKDIFEISKENGLFDEVDRILENYEINGAKRSIPLGLVEKIEMLESPISVCTINSSKAAKIALEKAGILEKIECIIGRDKNKNKPDPEPLRLCIKKMGTSVGNSVFVGDSVSDAEAAYSAHMSYIHPDQIY